MPIASSAGRRPPPETHRPRRRTAQVPRLGFLTGSTLSAVTARNDAFRQGLAELGYVEDSTVVIEWRSAEGNQDRYSVLAAELVQLKVGIIVAAGPTDIR